jgi:prolyl oligopeptidase
VEILANTFAQARLVLSLRGMIQLLVSVRKLIWAGVPAALCACFASAATAAPADPYSWLEEIEGARALAWVEQHNEASAKRLTTRPEYKALYRDALAVLDSASRIPEVSAHGNYLYNFWQDADHPRGLFRRTTPSELKAESPHWEVVLDVDALSKVEGKPWSLGDVTWRRPDETRCLIELAPSGGDAAEIREFDATTLKFVSVGFQVPTAKSRVAWGGADEVFVGTDFGPGTMTQSGYPRMVKRWKRGTPLANAQLVHEAAADSVWAVGAELGEGEQKLQLITEKLTFWTAKFWQLQQGRKVELSIPATATVVDAFRGRLVIWLKEPWMVHGKTFSAGSVVIADPAALVGLRVSAGTEQRANPGTLPEPRPDSAPIETLLEPTASVVVEGVDVTAEGMLITTLDNVRGRLQRVVPSGHEWKRETIAFPDNGALRVLSANPDTGEAWVEYQSFTTPPTLNRVAPGATQVETVKEQAPTFDGERFEARQRWCTSADGTKIPYFVVGPKGMKHDGANPVWMFSYGGFENALTPAYSGSYEDLHGAYGKLWLERGGVFVLANIRGGGEFGPAWHHAAMKENHVKSFEDFEAVARDLVVSKITAPAHLGIEGRSNGGLLVGATMLRHPELYGAVVCGNPLLDMRRYHRLLAGASWMAEYGNPDDPAEWAYISRYSPYQNVRRGAALPPVMFYTSTRDDRVHPGHARKMAAKMEELGYTVDYYENTEGGHHGSVTHEQLATRLARTYTFLWAHVGREQ